MIYLLGTDEAGYGPNLGPLVVAATLWEVQGEAGDADLYERLKHCVTTKPPGKKRATNQHVWLADSKVVYQGGLAALERGVWLALGCAGVQLKQCADWTQLWASVCPDAAPQFVDQPWHHPYNEPLPLHHAGTNLSAEVSQFQAGLKQAGVRIISMSATVLFPKSFNEKLQSHTSKGEVLSLATLQLARRMLAGLPEPGPVLMCSDKHGGRNKYAAYLQHVFDEELIEVCTEGADLSMYRWGQAAARVEARFQPRGERFLPVALASMTAKYLREIAMRSFNLYWSTLIPGLPPTAGYPQDAQRFLASISSHSAYNALPADVLWRLK